MNQLSQNQDRATGLAKTHPASGFMAQRGALLIRKTLLLYHKLRVGIRAIFLILFALALVGLMSLKPSTATRTTSNYVTSPPQVVTYEPAAVGNRVMLNTVLADYGTFTRDTSTGLDWLDLTLSTNRSFNDVSTQFGPGGDFEGFRHATLQEVITFLQSANIPDIDAGLTVANENPVMALENLAGVTAPTSQCVGGLGSGIYNCGITGTDVGGVLQRIVFTRRVTGAAEVRTRDTGLDRRTANPVWGHWLVRNSPAQDCVQPPSGIVGWWPGDGNANDITGNNHGTATGGVTYSPGMVSQALLLDGIDDFVNSGNAPSLHVSSSDFTVDAWVRFNALSHPPGGNMSAPQGDMSIVSKMSNLGVNLDGWKLVKQNDNRFWFCFGGGDQNKCGLASHTVYSQTVATTGVWYHVAAVKTATDFSIYVNGVREDIRPLPNFLDSNSTDLLIGSFLEANRTIPEAHLNGFIDEVEIFNRALSLSEIRSLYNAGSAGKCKPESTDLAITKAFPSASILTGSTLTSTISVTNNGTATATDVTVTDNLPANTTFLSCHATSSGNCDVSDNNLTITFASLAAGASATITIDAIVDCSVTNNAVIVNSATVSSSLPDSDMNNNSSTAIATAVNPPPIITCPANINSAINVLDSCFAILNPGMATATDNCSGVAVTGIRSDGMALSSPYPLGDTIITWTATDSGGSSASCQQMVRVANPNPTVTITAPSSGAIYAVGTSVNFTGTLTDNPGTHTSTWMFDNISQAGSVNETTGALSTTHTFTSAGVYLVTLTVSDGCGGTGTTNTVDGLTAMVVVYDPNGGFVTGGGWFDSPFGAYIADPMQTGKASFGFVSRYLPGAIVPSGNTEFQFRAAGFNFKSTSYDWLVVAGARAQYKGTGTVNGSGNYGFMLTAIDGQVNGGGGMDKLRIKIWDRNNNNAIVYDNQMNTPDSSDPSTALGGGNVVIHR